MSRRDAREKVIQALYQLDFHRDRCDLPDDWLNGLRERDLLFYRELLTGVRNRLDKLDQMIRPALKDGRSRGCQPLTAPFFVSGRMN